MKLLALVTIRRASPTRFAIPEGGVPQRPKSHDVPPSLLATSGLFRLRSATGDTRPDRRDLRVVFPLALCGRRGDLARNGAHARRDRGGYGSEAAFSRAFKKIVGVAPAAWRAKSA